MINDYISIISRNFARRKLRGWLTILGILIGITAVVSLVSLGQGLSGYVNEQFEKMVSDKIMITPGSSMAGMMGGTDVKLTEDDLSAVQNVRGVKIAGGWLYSMTNIKFRDETKQTWVIGIPLDETHEIVSSMLSFKILDGRDLKVGDKGKIVIGYNLYTGDFFDKGVKVGDTLIIKEQEFSVIGVVDKIGNPGDDAQVYIAMDDAREIFNNPDEYNMLMVQVVKGTDINSISEAIKKRLRNTRDVKEGEEDFNVQTTEELMKTSLSILSIVQAVIVAIAAISLLVGGIGIMNTMYTSVLERTREIGIMKAIGARNSDILAIFLIESGMIGLVGGAIGALFGVALSKIAEFGAAYAGYGILKISFSPTLIIGVLLFSFITGMISGITPAMQAARMKPVEALRYE